MLGDFSRHTFNAKKNFTRVLKQQGRVDLDADANELMEIITQLARQQGIDVIGRAGVPKDERGFGIVQVIDDTLEISSGRIYVDGIMCNLPDSVVLPVTDIPEPDLVTISDFSPNDTAFAPDQYVAFMAEGFDDRIARIVAVDAEVNQLRVDVDVSDLAAAPQVFLVRLITLDMLPDMVEPPIIVPPDVGDPARTDFVYLDVWERHITAIEDPDIRESALGGPDTTTRTKTICQVRLLPDVGDVTCEEDIPNYPPPAGDARLTTRADAPPDSTDPCVIAPGGGYRGLENLLYRVEIHYGSSSGTPTFKWSRHNGSVVYAVEAFVPGEPEKVRVKQLGRDQLLTLKTDDWVEVCDDATDLSSSPGVMAQIVDIDAAQRILTLSKPVTGFSPSAHPKVRRWDQPSDAIPITAGQVALEDGITVEFSGTQFNSGDYWQFAARTVTADGTSGIEELTDAPPHGIEHDYAPLALLAWDAPTEGNPTPLEILDCRQPFPPLNNITADDVYYDNSECQLVDARTVQDAIDTLCNLNDIRHHNKHLHGWGVVCGLQVICGPDQDGVLRRHVTVRDGYAIDCDGNNLILDQDLELDIMKRVEVLLERGELGDADLERGFDVMLAMGLDANQQIVFDVEPYDPSKRFDMQDMLSGTLLMDFYQNCIQSLVDALREEITEPDDDVSAEGDVLVSPYTKRLISLVLLLFQFIYPDYGRYIFLSRREHAILHELFLRLREIIRSETFCAMFDDDPPFPDYPFPEHDITTIFGVDYNPRLRLSPDGTRGYTLGLSKTINVYDMERGEMIQKIEVPGGEAIVARDLVFEPNGRVMHVVATVNNVDTIFATADVNGDQYTWQPINIICDVKLVTLGLLPKFTDTVYAVGINSGLYAINPENIPAELAPLVEFNAVGHMQVAPDLSTIFATASSADVEMTVYNQFIQIQLDADEPLTAVHPLSDAAGNESYSGDDDFLVVPGRRPLVYVVVDDPAAEKRLLEFALPDSPPEEPVAFMNAVPLPDTAIRLGYVPDREFVMVSLADRFRVVLYVMGSNEMIPEDQFAFPVQFFPTHIVHDPNLERVYVKHYGTILSIPQQYMTPDATDVDPRAGSPEFLNELAEYREALILAFSGIAGNLLQYIKDCFCDHLLVNCPECTGEEVIYLAAVKIRDRQVYQICNFTRRKHVKTFPKIDYWLSLIPVAPLAGRLIEEVCCWVLPDWFLRQGQNLTSMENQNRLTVKSQPLAYSLANVTKLRPASLFQGVGRNFGLAGNLATETIQRALVRKPEPTVEKEVAVQSDIVGKSVNSAKAKLERTGATVTKIEPFDESAGVANVIRAGAAPNRIPPQAEVTLFEENGVVKYYRVDSPRISIAVDRERESIQPDIGVAQPVDAQETITVPGLNARLEEMRSSILKKDNEIERLRVQVNELETARAQVNELETELKDMREFRKQVERFMRRNNG